VLGQSRGLQLAHAFDAVSHAERCGAYPLHPGRDLDHVVELKAALVVDLDPGRGEVQALIDVGGVRLVVFCQPVDARARSKKRR
jgi:hypothetical protein